jgi:septal ring factor EnvC (AmiA/AmiB activator)
MSFHKAANYAVNFGLDSDNVLRIGGWSAPANRWQLDMSGNGTYAGTVTANSDIKLKENIEVINNALEKVSQIRGVTFTRNDQEDKEKRHAGVIAQEVEKVLPEVVVEGNDGIKSVAYGNLVGLLIEAIKEQQESIKGQQKQINTLTDEIAKLKK